jgi:transposase IS200 family protein
LGACVVMANHVHLLIRPAIAPDRLMKSLEGATARGGKSSVGSNRAAILAKESYDHWARNEMELGRIRRYIENNPVNAGIVGDARDYPWSSAGVETSRRGTQSACATLSSAHGPNALAPLRA